MASSKPVAERHGVETIVEMARLNGLSDGVFAFGLTLLVLEIVIPEETGEADLGATLLKLVPKLVVYLISFVVIGGAWGSHQRMLSQIRRGDGPLVWLNLLSLLFVTLLPAAAALLGKFPNTFLGLCIFAVVVILIQLSALLLWHHAGKQGLLNPALDPRVVVAIGRRLLYAAIGFAITIPIALWNAIPVYVIWFGMFLALFTTDFLSWQQGIQTRHMSVPLQDAKRASVAVQYSAGRLEIGALSNTRELVDGRFGGGVVTQVRRSEDQLDVGLAKSNKLGLMSLRYPWAWGAANILDWKFGLADSIPMAVSMQLAGGECELDFENVRVTDLKIEASATAATVTLPAHVSVGQVKIEASSASFVVRVPAGVAARVVMVESIGMADLDSVRFPAVTPGREYRSADYDTATNRIEMTVNLSAGSIKIF